MTPEEKIEALRRWAKRDRTYWSFEKTAGYTDAQREVRAIIDPPKPRWRELVGQAAKVVTDNPLEGVLKHLSVIAYNPSQEGLEWNLARIVAICEQEVGDGWEADPDEWGDTVTMHDLLGRLACLEYDDHAMRLGKVTDWQGLGHAAAAWLRSLTDGGAS